MNRLRVAERARRDIDALIAYGQQEFGDVAAERYRRLLDRGFELLRFDPERNGVRRNILLSGELRFYHLRHARAQLPASVRVARPRHLIVFRFADNLVEVLRVLHDAMDLPRHLGTDDT